MTQTIAEHFEGQGRACDELGSPFTAELCRLLGERLDRESRFGRRILDWTGDPRADALALRVCGAFHALARSGRAQYLRKAYPPAQVDRDLLWLDVAQAIRQHDEFLTAWLDSPPQTNEVARSAMVLGAALVAAEVVRLPLALFEIGSSAGLNLSFDRYRYELGGGRSWGAADAPVTVASEWRGEIPPLDAPLQVVSRKGCDRNPLDPSSPDDVARLTSYIWPDQTARLQRIESALRLAVTAGIRVERADAAAWVERELASPPQPGICRFVFHTIVRQYLPDETKSRIDAALARAGAAATPETPLAHFSFEADGAAPGAPMTLTLWPGERVIHLGRADYHGRWVEWVQPGK